MRKLNMFLLGVALSLGAANAQEGGWCQGVPGDYDASTDVTKAFATLKLNKVATEPSGLGSKRWLSILNDSVVVKQGDAVNQGLIVVPGLDKPRIDSVLNEEADLNFSIKGYWTESGITILLNVNDEDVVDDKDLIEYSFTPYVNADLSAYKLAVNNSDGKVQSYCGFFEPTTWLKFMGHGMWSQFGAHKVYGTPLSDVGSITPPIEAYLPWGINHDSIGSARNPKDIGLGKTITGGYSKFWNKDNTSDTAITAYKSNKTGGYYYNFTIPTAVFADAYKPVADGKMAISIKIHDYDADNYNNSATEIWTARNNDAYYLPSYWGIVLDLKNPNGVNISTIEEKNSNLYFNNGNINLTNSADVKSISVYNMVGVEIMKVQNPTSIVSLANLQNGVYIVRAENLNGSFASLKVIK